MTSDLKKLTGAYKQMSQELEITRRTFAKSKTAIGNALNMIQMEIKDDDIVERLCNILIS